MENIANAVDISGASEMMSAVIGNAFLKNQIPQNICLHGSPGLGKSAITWQLAESLGKQLGKEVEVIDIRLSAMEAADVQGIPYVADAGFRLKAVHSSGEEFEYDAKEMFFSTPAWWPRDPNKYYILFLDELLNCGPQVQHAAYRLILDRSIQNGSVLPDNCAIVAAGNLKEDKTGAKPLMPAAANRFGLHLVIDRKRAHESFIEYAFNRRMEESIIGFMNWQTSEAIYKAPVDGEAAFATPRSWEFLNDHLQNPLLAGNRRLLSIAAAGAVGSAMSNKFMGFLDYYDKLPNWQDIRKKGVKYDMPKDDETLKYAVASAITYQFLEAMNLEDEKQSQKEVSNLCEVMKHLPPESKTISFKLMRSDEATMVKFIDYPDLLAEFNKVSKHIKYRS